MTQINKFSEGTRGDLNDGYHDGKLIRRGRMSLAGMKEPLVAAEGWKARGYLVGQDS